MKLLRSNIDFTNIPEYQLHRCHEETEPSWCPLSYHSLGIWTMILYQQEDLHYLKCEEFNCCLHEQIDIIIILSSTAFSKRFEVAGDSWKEAGTRSNLACFFVIIVIESSHFVVGANLNVAGNIASHWHILTTLHQEKEISWELD